MFAARLLTRVAVARPAVSYMAARSFATPSAPVMQDILKELYIKELKGYKPTPDAKGANTSSQVKDFKAPPTPAVPVIDASADLAAWEQDNVEVAEAVSVEAFDDLEEEEEEEEEHHH